MQKQKDSIICNNGSGSSTDNNLIDSNNNGLNLANKYAKPRPKSADRFLSRGNRDINAIKRNPNKCNVQLQTNQHGYKPVSPLGPAGTYTKKGTTSEQVKVGVSSRRSAVMFWC